MNEKKSRYLTVHYTVIQILMNALYLSIIGFASVYLRSRGMEDSVIGVVLAVGALISIVTQPFLGSFADRTRRMSLNQLMAIFAGGMVVFALLLLVAAKSLVLVALLFVVLRFLMGVTETFTNGLAAVQINQGVNINFGLARGIGSGGYAVASYLVGCISAASGEDSILVCVIVLAVMMVVALLLLGGRRPTADKGAAGTVRAGADVQTCTEKEVDVDELTCAEKGAGADARPEEEPSDTMGLWPFIRSNPCFCIFVLSVALLFFCHSIRANYMYQIMLNVGCTVEQFGTMSAYTSLVAMPTMMCFSLMLKRFKARTIMLFAAVCLIIRTIIVALAGNLFWLYVGNTFQMITYGLFIPASVYYVNEWIGKANVNKGQSFLGIAQQTSTILATLFGGVMLSANNGDPRSMLLTAAAFSAIGAVLLFFFTPKVEK